MSLSSRGLHIVDTGCEQLGVDGFAVWSDLDTVRSVAWRGVAWRVCMYVTCSLPSSLLRCLPTNRAFISWQVPRPSLKTNRRTLHQSSLFIHQSSRRLSVIVACCLCGLIVVRSFVYRLIHTCSVGAPRVLVVVNPNTCWCFTNWNKLLCAHRHLLAPVRFIFFTQVQGSILCRVRSHAGAVLRRSHLLLDGFRVQPDADLLRDDAAQALAARQRGLPRN